MVSETDQQFYDQNGFLVVRQFLPPEELDALQGELDRYIDEVVPTLSGFDAFYEDASRPETLKQLQRMAQDDFFAAYQANRRWHELATALVGEEVTASEPEWFNKPPGTNHITPPHQDNFYFCQTPPHVVTLWLALERVGAENGCLRYVAGSHREGFRPHSKSSILGFSQGINNYTPDDFRREVAVPLEAGDLVAHHGMTIHRADANMSTTQHRRSFAMVFTGVSCRRDMDAFARYQDSARQQHAELGLK